MMGVHSVQVGTSVSCILWALQLRVTASPGPVAVDMFIGTSAQLLISVINSIYTVSLHANEPKVQAAQKKSC